MKLLWWNNDYLSFNQLPFLIKIGMVAVCIISIIALIIFLGKPTDFKNSGEFAYQYNKAAKLSSKKPISKLVWCIQTRPIDKKGNPVLPYSLMHFNRYLFIIDTLFWSESLRLKKEGKIFYLRLFFFIRFMMVLFTFTVMYSWIAWLIRITEFQRVDFIAATFYLLVWAIAFSMVPAIYFSIQAAEILYKMDISVKQRDAIMLRIKLLWLFPFAITLFETFRFIIQIFDLFKKKK